MKSQRLLLSLVVFALCVCWSGVSNVSTSFAEETDPQVGNNTTGYIPKWDGSALVTGSIFDNGNIGVGTATPSSKFHVFTQSAGVGLFESNTTQAYLKILTNEGTNNRVAICNRPGGRLSLFTAGGGDVLNITRDGNVGIGTTVPPVGHKLAVNGSIKAKQVVVETTGWSDFVFEKNYKLIPLEKLEESIEKNGHLPDIPSAKEVAEKGINIGEIQAKLLQKIEELTLHMIEQNKRMNSLEQENKVLRAQTSLLLRNGR